MSKVPKPAPVGPAPSRPKLYPMVLWDDMTENMLCAIRKSIEPMDHWQFNPKVKDCYNYDMDTPEGKAVRVEVPDASSLGRAVTMHDDLYNCIAYAFGTWNAEKRLGYAIAMESDGVYRLLLSAGLAREIRDKNGTVTGPIQKGDIVVVWEKEKEHDACHAAIINEPAEVTNQGFNVSETTVNTKNGNNEVKIGMKLQVMLNLEDYSGRLWSVHRITPRPGEHKQWIPTPPQPPPLSPLPAPALKA